MECDLLPAARTWDDAAPAALESYRLHIRFCSACRTRVLAEAPDQLLFDIRPAPLPQDFWLGFWDSVQQKAFIEKKPLLMFAPIRWVAVLVIGLLILLYGRSLPEEEPVRMMEVHSYPVIEDLQNPQARYYIFQSGAQNKIVMVFDPDMEL